MLPASELLISGAVPSPDIVDEEKDSWASEI
jgi:hypothetical protein